MGFIQKLTNGAGRQALLAGLLLEVLEELSGFADVLPVLIELLFGVLHLPFGGGFYLTVRHPYPTVDEFGHLVLEVFTFAYQQP